MRPRQCYLKLAKQGRLQNIRYIH